MNIKILWAKVIKGNDSIIDRMNRLNELTKEGLVDCYQYGHLEVVIKGSTKGWGV